MDENVGVKAEFVMDDPRNYTPVEADYPDETPREQCYPAYIDQTKEEK